LEDQDVVLLTGGVSVGDYDFVLRAAENSGVTQVFHKVKQRPGKPLYFGMKQSKVVFGLPGNPSSVLTCFYQYVQPALEQMMKRGNSTRIIHVPLGKTFKKTVALTFFLKGYYDGAAAFPLDAQESYRMSSFAKANCLIKIEEGTMERKEGELTEVHLFPHNN
jgi:molybdopterin molybdotransferase